MQTAHNGPARPAHATHKPRAPHSGRALRMALAWAALLLAGLVLLSARPAHAQDATAPVTGTTAITATTPASPASPTVSATAAATAASTATVIVQTERGLLVRPITFTAPISGLAALQATGLDITVADTSFGPAVCAIAGAGCPVTDCFCGGGDGSLFWNYSAWDGSGWAGYPVGAASSLITQTGAIEGWRWGVFTGTAASPAGIAQAVPAALDWLDAQQSPRDGGYVNMGGAAETLFAIGANGLAARDWATANGRTLERYVRAQQTKFARADAAGAGKVAVGLAAADACWNGRARLPMAWFDEASGAYSPDAGFNAWGILGTLALSESVPAGAVDALRASILPAGGWEWQAGFGPDSNTTALAIQALVAAGAPVTATEIVSGLAFLKQAQQPDGGFAYDLTGGGGSDANSTAYALQALAAVGQDPASAAWLAEGVSPVDFLLSLQLPEGAFEWQPGSGPNLFATQQAIPALLQRPYPIAVRPVERCAWK